MGSYERMTLVVPDQMGAKIHAAVEAGEYASASEVVRDAVRLWSERREIHQDGLPTLCEACNCGKASGVVGTLDMEAIATRAKGRTVAVPAIAEIIVSQQANEDFEKIWLNLALDDDDAVDRLLRTLKVKIESLRIFPEVGSV
jgi:antitoxin ParD1/3/4